MQWSIFSLLKYTLVPTSITYWKNVLFFGGNVMKNGKEQKKTSPNQIVAIVITILGFILGGLFYVRTKDWLVFLVFGFFALAEAFIVRFVLNRELKNWLSGSTIKSENQRRGFFCFDHTKGI